MPSEHLVFLKHCDDGGGLGGRVWAMTGEWGLRELSDDLIRKYVPKPLEGTMPVFRREKTSSSVIALNNAPSAPSLKNAVPPGPCALPSLSTS
jgi:hypothetical protein